MRRLGAMACLALLATSLPPQARASEIRMKEVSSLTDVDDVAPSTVAFTDRHDDKLADPVTGLISFDDWARAMPLQKRFLSPYPGYQQRTLSASADGAAQPSSERLQVYVAKARFVVSKPPEAIDLTRYMTIGFLEQIDPAIKHRVIPPDQADNSTNDHPARRWCEPHARVMCIQSHYQLEGKLPMGVRLVNQLTSRKTVADYLEFQSELRVLPPADRDQPALTKLTEIDAPITGGLEQTIFHVNQIMRFGKLVALLQQDPADPQRTVATAFIALALKTRLLERHKRYESIPVLRNLIPAQVLVGKSTFNAGNSISAGLPVYARNNIKAIVGILEQP